MRCALNKVPGFLENEGCASLQEIVEKEGLQSGVLTTFVWQPSFVCNNFPAVPLTIICPTWGVDREPARDLPVKTLFPWCSTHNKLAVKSKDASEGEEVLSCGCKLSEVRLLKLIHPSFPGVEGGIVHTKLMLLRYTDKVRFVVGSANLHREDWEEYGELTWWCDFPLREKPVADADILTYDSTPDEGDSLGTELASLLKRMGCEEELLSQHVYSADFSSSPAHLITSAPGHFPLNGEGEESAHNYGNLRLRGLLNTHCKDWDWKDAHIDIQVSSVGGSGIHWYSNFLRSLAPERAGEEKEKDKDWRKKSTDRDEDEEDADEDGEDEEGTPKRDRKPVDLSLLRVFYPSERHLDSLPEKMRQYQNTSAYWDALRIVRPRLHQHHSPALVTDKKPLLWHSKVMSRILPPTEGSAQRHGWLYIGSHNLSGAAWGNIAKDGNTMKMANYEAGLLFISPSDKGAATGPVVEDLAVFKNLPYEPTYDDAARVPYETTDRPHLGSAAELGAVAYMITGIVTKWKEGVVQGRGFGFVRGTPEKAYVDFMKKKDAEKPVEEAPKGIYQPRKGRGGPVDVFLREDVMARSGFQGNLVEGSTVVLEAIEQVERQEAQGWKATWVLSIDDSTATKKETRTFTSPERRSATPERSAEANNKPWERRKEGTQPQQPQGGSDWTVVEKPKRRGKEEESDSPSRAGNQSSNSWSRGGGGRGRASPDRSDRPSGAYNRSSPASGVRTWGDKQGRNEGSSPSRFNTDGGGWRSSPKADTPPKQGGRGGSAPAAKGWGTGN